MLTVGTRTEFNSLVKKATDSLLYDGDGVPSLHCKHSQITRQDCKQSGSTKRTKSYRICTCRTEMRSNWIQVGVVVILFILTCCCVASPVRTSKDLASIIDLDHEYLKFGTYHNDLDAVDTIEYYFRHDKEAPFAKLHRNSDIDLNSPLCFHEVSLNKVICEYGTHRNINFYRDEEHDIAVAIANENGTMKIHGVVNSGNSTTELEPLQDHTLPTNRYHVLKKRWTANLVRKPVSSYKPYKTPESPYKNLPDWVSSSGYCVDILCVVDYSIYKKFKESEKTEAKAIEKIRYYYAHVINGINMRYSSIAQKDFSITVRLAGYFIAKNPEDLPFIDAKKMANDEGYRVDSNYTLTRLDAFLKDLEKTKSHVLPEYNHAMLFLEYASTNLGGSVLGTSFVSGICSSSKSTSLVVDHGAYTSAGIGCHELGHNLGVYWHDGEGTSRSTSCNASLNYIMAPASFLIDEKNLRYSFTFSECSLAQMKAHLDTIVKLGRNCLQCNQRDRASHAGRQIEQEVNNHMAVLPGEIDDVHTQCRQLYGNGSFMCPPNSPDEMCFRMYCYDPKRSACAIISEQMAVIGTPCGKYKICKLGKCIADDKGKDVPDDCPYPDIPSNGAHCEDASPFMCKNDRFKQKCCQACNKKFTAEEACKDSHILINGMTCEQLMGSVFGRPGCTSDYNVQNMCCKSCKRLMATSDVSDSMPGILIHLGTGPHFGPQTSFRRTVKRTFRTISNKVSNSRQDMTHRDPSHGERNDQNGSTYKVPYTEPEPQISQPPSSCVDNPSITFNQKTCPDIGKNYSYYCSNCQVQSVCCESCWPHRSKYTNC